MAAIAASPTMVGAVTTLIVIVAVFLAYNANAGPAVRPGLPRLARDPRRGAADGQQRGPDRRPPGRRGRVDRRGAARRGDGDRPGERHQRGRRRQTGGVVARLNLKLDKDAEPLPKDSVFRVRYRSSFGLKYLEIVRGEGDPAPEGFVFDGLDDQTDRATACYLPGDPRFASAAERAERLLRAADRVRRHQQHLRHADADQRAHQPRGLRQRLRRPRDLAQRRDQQPRAAVHRAAARDQGAAGARHAAAALLPRARRRSPDPGAGRRAAGRRVHQGRDRLRRDLVRPGGARRRRSPRARRRCRPGSTCCRASARSCATSRRSARSCARASTTCGRPCPCSTTRSRSGTPVLRRSTDTSRAPRGRPALARPPRHPADHRGDAAAPAGHLRRGEAAGEVGGPGADRLQLLQLLVHLPAERPLRSRPDRATRSARCSPTSRLGPMEPASAPATRACSPTARTRRASSSPYDLPILNAHAYQPTGQHNADCQGGQFGYALGQGLLPGQAPSNPAYGAPDLPGSRGPTTLFTNDAGNRELVDTRNPSRQPADLGERPMRRERQPPPAELGDRARARDRDRDRVATSRSRRSCRGATPTRSRPCSARRRTSGPSRRCGSRASTSARSPRSSTSTSADDTSRAQTGGDRRHEDQPQASRRVVTMELNEDALPLHEDATFKLRPRLFLEGNYFVDVQPGSPNAPETPENHTFPVNQTSYSVQLDQVLTTLQGDVRTDLQTFLDQLGNALVKDGGAEGFRELYRTSAPAGKYTSQVNQARARHAARRPHRPDPTASTASSAGSAATRARCRASSPTSASSRARSPPRTSPWARRSRSFRTRSRPRSPPSPT